MGTAWKYVRTSRQLSSTSFQDKVNQWKFTWGRGCSVPLLYSRGSVIILGSARPETVSK